MVEPRADESENDAEHRDVQHVLRVLAEALRLALRQHDAREQPRKDHQRVVAYLQAEEDEAAKRDVEVHTGSRGVGSRYRAWAGRGLVSL